MMVDNMGEAVKLNKTEPTFKVFPSSWEKTCIQQPLIVWGEVH